MYLVEFLEEDEAWSKRRLKKLEAPGGQKKPTKLPWGPPGAVVHRKAMCTQCTKSPFPGALTVTFMLHRWPWQHLTTRAGDGGVAQVARPSSSSLRQPFCWTAAPSIIFREEKQCWPLQRWCGSHGAPSHTQYCWLSAGLPADGSVSDEGERRRSTTEAIKAAQLTSHERTEVQNTLAQAASVIAKPFPMIT